MDLKINEHFYENPTLVNAADLGPCAHIPATTCCKPSLFTYINDLYATLRKQSIDALEEQDGPLTDIHMLLNDLVANSRQSDGSLLIDFNAVDGDVLDFVGKTLTDLVNNIDVPAALDDVVDNLKEGIDNVIQQIKDADPDQLVWTSPEGGYDTEKQTYVQTVLQGQISAMCAACAPHEIDEDAQDFADNVILASEDSCSALAERFSVIRNATMDAAVEIYDVFVAWAKKINDTIPFDTFNRTEFIEGLVSITSDVHSGLDMFVTEMLKPDGRLRSTVNWGGIKPGDFKELLTNGTLDKLFSAFDDDEVSPEDVLVGKPIPEGPAAVSFARSPIVTLQEMVPPEDLSAQTSGQSAVVSDEPVLIQCVKSINTDVPGVIDLQAAKVSLLSTSVLPDAQSNPAESDDKSGTDSDGFIAKVSPSAAAPTGGFAISTALLLAVAFLAAA